MGLATDSDAGPQQASADRSGIHPLFIATLQDCGAIFFRFQTLSSPLLHAGFHLRGLHIMWKLKRFLQVFQVGQRNARLVAGVDLIALDPFVEGLRNATDIGRDGFDDRP